jgi:hypothetical protein
MPKSRRQVCAQLIQDHSTTWIEGRYMPNYRDYYNWKTAWWKLVTDHFPEEHRYLCTRSSVKAVASTRQD